MKANHALAAALLTAGIAISFAGVADAQEMNMREGMGMRAPMSTQSDANSRTTARSEMPCGEMGRAGMRSGMMGSGMTGSAMMGARMMGSGMMQSGRGGMDALFGTRVERMLNLTADDVRSYLTFRLEQLKNKRLKVGDTKVEDGAVTADVVTVDNSLVQRLKVDRHTGAIEYQD
jgi:hypothetical protein